MFKALLDKEKREEVQEVVSVIFAALTIASFANKKYKQHKALPVPPASVN